VGGRGLEGKGGWATSPVLLAIAGDGTGNSSTDETMAGGGLSRNNNEQRRREKKGKIYSISISRNLLRRGFLTDLSALSG